jgi:hypothetical protein
MDQNKCGFLLLATGSKIEKILKVADYQEARIKAQDKKLWKYRVVFLAFDESIKIPKVGEYLPNCGYSSFGVVIIRNQIKAERKYTKPDLNFNQEKDDAQNLALLENYFKNLSLEKINKISEVVESQNLQQDPEVFYRCLYHSFKMYRLRESSIVLVRSLLELVGVEPKANYYEMLDQLSDNKFSQILIRLVKSSIESPWHQERNDLDCWVEDSQKLFSANIILYQSVKFILEFSKELLNKEGIFYSTRGVLSWNQAGAMEVWDVLVGARYNRSYVQKFKDRNLT